jgi:hypothetical protein
MRPPRPTLRCVTEDLRLPVPPTNKPLDELDHPVLAKAAEQFASHEQPHERIRAIDDHVFFKVKVQRWRGAVWIEADLPWLVAAGTRESGSPDDFYKALADVGQAARARYNAANSPAMTTVTYTGQLLPGHDDRLRYQLEAGVRFVRRLEALIPALVRDSLRDGHEHTADLRTFSIGVQVRADEGHETYVAVRITGSVPDNLIQIILDIVPGCDHSGWFPEAILPHRRLAPNEQAWSNIMDPKAAGELLEDERL